MADVPTSPGRLGRWISGRVCFVCNLVPLEAKCLAIIRQANYEPNAYICEPAIMHAVMETKDSNNLWLSAPSTLDGIRGYSTSNCASGEAVVGDFSQAAFCMQHGLRVEVSTQAGDGFSKHQVAIKMFMRVDFSTLNDAAFRRISGTTAS